MIKNRPLEILEVQFCKLIRYWSLPDIKTKLRNRLEAGENDEDAFVGVLGKDQPGRVRCYGASITRSSLKKDEEIHHIKVEYNAHVSSLEKKMDGVCGLLKVLVHQINPGMSDEEVAALMQAAQNSSLDTSSSRAKNTPCSSESTHIPHKDDGSGQNNFARNG
ncbi:uncharacterized protein LOC107624944 isoform X2 [Arachis ipaensis]|uniref:uncharacterized protein LOC107624944 isoform X2 n=1 Tax=Arachis ipaensis TaxID=130454 RepID=UPI000A2B589D|nr:uncharacterized protein LOC107624944 isoform X2 [Arachis ipaensis]